jgi:glyoxylase-like metal-dependent hydrolase (beta-lactamase superfamily II)
MIVDVFPSGPFATNAYVAACPHTRQAALIDAPPNSLKKYSAFLEEQQLKPVALLLTHSHWDHIADAAALKEHFLIPVYIHSLDAPNLRAPGTDGLPCWLKIQGVEPDRLIAEGDCLPVGELEFEVIHTPGHTPGGVCFYCRQEELLFSGDTLFKGTIGNLSFPTCCPDKMWPSLDKLAKLPAKTQVYPGHGERTTIGREQWLPNAKQIFG